MNGESEPRFRLVVFAKLPRPEKVKTRLAASVGPEKAAALYRAWVPFFIETLVGMGGEVSVGVYLDATESREGGNLITAREWLPFEIDWDLQVGPDLGAKIAHAFVKEFEKGWKQVFIFGSDSPQLSRRQIEANLRLLENHDMVLGPAEDGGYYAIGLKHPPPHGLFEKINWSSNTTLEETERAASRRGWKVGTGPLCYDVDTLEDLERLIRIDELRWSALKRLLEGN